MPNAAMLRTNMNKKNTFGKKAQNQIRKFVAKKPLKVPKFRCLANATVNYTKTIGINKAKSFGKTKIFNKTTFGKRINATTNKTKRSIKTKTIFPVRTVIKNVRLHDARPKARLPKTGPKPIRVNKRTGLPWNYDRTVKRIMNYVNPNLFESLPKTHDQLLEEILTKAFVNLIHRTGCNCFENHNFSNELVRNVARTMYKTKHFSNFGQVHDRENAALTKFHNASKAINHHKKQRYF